jgi:predicted Zn finger-like uncharacterized protein
MDVRCERCRTEYEFDDAKITVAGVTVKCTSCGHVFKVAKAAMGGAQRPEEARGGSHAGAAYGDATAVGAPTFNSGFNPIPASPADDKPKEWKIRQPNGNVFTFRELTTLQKWIVERKVARDDEISLTGESWKRLGTIAELASFFQVVEAADRALAAQPTKVYETTPPHPRSPYSGGGALPSPPGSGAGAVASPGMQMPVPRPSVPSAQVPARPQAREPARPAPAPRAAAAPEQELLPDEMDLVRGSGWGMYALIGVAFTAAVAGGVYMSRSSHTPAPAAVSEPAKPAVLEAAPVAAPKLPEPALAEPSKGDEAAKTKPAEAPKAPEVMVAKATEPAKPADVKPAEPAKPKDPTAGMSFETLLEQANRRREVGRKEQALDLYNKAAVLNPASLEPLAGKAFCMLDMGNVDAAIRGFEEVLEKNPRYSDAFIGIAEAFKEKGNNKKAVEYYKKYLDVLPSGPEASVAQTNIERLGAQ